MLQRSLDDSLQSQSISYSNKILDMDKYNGRVNVLSPENPEIQFQMFERVAVKNKPTEYSEALGGMWEDNVIAQVFFSSDNIQIIQNGIKAGVYKLSNNKYVLPNQNIDALKIIMRSVYVQFAKHQSSNITFQISELNSHVLDYSINYCYSEAVSYSKYLRDQSTLVVPLEHAQHPDRDYKQLELKPWF